MNSAKSAKLCAFSTTKVGRKREYELKNSTELKYTITVAICASSLVSTAFFCHWNFYIKIIGRLCLHNDGINRGCVILLNWNRICDLLPICNYFTL